MKKLLIVLFSVLAVTTFLENAYARGCNFDYFYLDHAHREVRLELFPTLKDQLLTSSGESFEGEGRTIIPPEFISLSNLIDQETKYKTSDGFDINLNRLSEDLERFGLTLKVTKSDSTYKEPDDNYLKELNYSIGLSYKF